MTSNEALILATAPAYLDELRSANAAIFRHADACRAKGQTGENSTSSQDALLLYLLVRHFKRRRVLDVGTNIGVTAMALHLAATKNGGSCVTCDPTDYSCLPADSPRFIHASSADALAQLKAEGRTIDFAFFDWVPDERTLNLMADVFTRDAIIAVHDYAINAKGQAIIDAINAGYSPVHRGEWIIPKTSPTQVDDISVNICTAYWLPFSLTLGENQIERFVRRLRQLAQLILPPRDGR